jgi:high affinity Mn2+ porin
MRVGWNDGQTESFTFTEIDRTIAVGLSRDQPFRRRPDDVCGIAYVSNGLSAAHRDYLAAGGLGFILGDGQLNYQPEQILEMYYRWTFRGVDLHLTPDYQFIGNPGYNHDRGPLSVWSLRVHGEF